MAFYCKKITEYPELVKRENVIGAADENDL